MPQIKVLAELGQAGDLAPVRGREVEAYPAPRHIKRLMMLLTDWGYPEIAVRLAKGPSYAGTPMLAFTHPVIACPPIPARAAPPSRRWCWA